MPENALVRGDLKFQKYISVFPVGECAAQTRTAEKREKCFEEKEKRISASEDPVILRLSRSDSTGNLAGTQAAGAGVNALRAAVHDRLDAPNVRLPGSVRPSMGMGHLNAKSNILATNFTLCHVCTSFEDDIIGLQHPYSIRFYEEKQALF